MLQEYLFFVNYRGSALWRLIDKSLRPVNKVVFPMKNKKTFTHLMLLMLYQLSVADILEYAGHTGHFLSHGPNEKKCHRILKISSLIKFVIKQGDRGPLLN